MLSQDFQKVDGRASSAEIASKRINERIYFFEPLDEDMTVAELQELMDENEKFLLGEMKKMIKEKL